MSDEEIYLVFRAMLATACFWTTLECLSPRPTKFGNLGDVTIRPLVPTVLLAVLLMTYLHDL